MNHNLLSIIFGKSHKIIIPNIFCYNSIAILSKYFHPFIKENYCINAIKHNNLKYFIMWCDSLGKNFDIIYLTCKLGNLNIVKYLHHNGLNIICDDYTFQIAFQTACEYRHLDLIKYLHLNGANLHADNDWAIKRANQNNYLDVVEYLSQHGAKI